MIQPRKRYVLNVSLYQYVQVDAEEAEYLGMVLSTIQMVMIYRRLW